MGRGCYVYHRGRSTTNSIRPASLWENEATPLLEKPGRRYSRFDQKSFASFDIFSFEDCKIISMVVDWMEKWKVNGLYNGAPSIIFSAVEEEVLAGKFSRTLIGRSKERISLSALEDFLVRGGFKEFKLRRLGNFEVLFIFKQEDDYQSPKALGNPCSTLLHIGGDASDEESSGTGGTVLNTATRGRISSEVENPNLMDGPNSFPDLSFLEVPYSSSCMAIIPYVPHDPTLAPSHACTFASQTMGSFDDGWIGTRFEIGETSSPLDTPYGCHSEGGNEETPFDTSELLPLAMDILKGPKSSMPLPRCPRLKKPPPPPGMQRDNAPLMIKVWKILTAASPTVNYTVQTLRGDVDLSHLPKANSDHKALLLHCHDQHHSGSWTFRFINSWTHHDNFKQVVKNSWKRSPTFGGMRGLFSKLKALKLALRDWNHKEFGNIFEQARKAEEYASLTLEAYDLDPTDRKRETAQLANAKLILAVKKEDVLKASQDFFLGMPIPKGYGSTFLTLIPKKSQPKTFDDFKPISLSTFMSKINTKLLANRLKKLLLKIISEEQAAFQKGKGIDDHILMAKEAIHHLDRKVFGGNLIIKIDMAKAFDRMAWSYLESTLKGFGFSCLSIKLLMANLNSTFISILLNGEPTGFFRMTRGVKQGDPLSPLLFIIGGEGFSRLLNHHLETTFIKRYKGVGHLIYADDLMIFTKGDTRNLLRLKGVLLDYLGASGQQINYNKSHFYCSKNTSKEHISHIEKILGMTTGSLPFTYLGGTICKGVLRKEHCSSLLEHFDNHISSWYSKILNQMGRLILIKHVLSPIPLHIMAVHTLPKSIHARLNTLMANFYRGQKGGWPKYHWIKWSDLCLPREAGGLGFKNLLTLEEAYGARYSSPLTLRQYMLQWWISGNTKNLKGCARLILPGIIPWCLWKARNLAICEGKETAKEGVIQQCFKLLQDLCWVNRNKKWMCHDADFNGWGLNHFWRTGKNFCF
ncbi:unnamed protein product [Cuscuta campestris]|uniref:Reverse transcriptase domain-containing protein n=1 Tax=Cuscuta campestris TaxID=132261 RepID=A0A484LAR1_9ASTE|nr:unnamed protein product [Cuscuta campestris]